MKLPLVYLAACAIAATCWLSCQKTESNVGTQPGTGHVAEVTTASITGRVLDNQKLPVSGAVVKAGTATATTDVNGTFTFTNISVDKHAAMVKVEKDGFFSGIRTLVVTSNKNNQTTIELIKKTVAGTFAGSAGGTVTLPSAGGSVEFEANSIYNTANNAGYTGTVSVSAFFINPTADNFTAIMPGTLRGIDDNNNETGLKSYGMMAVELNGANGEKLQIAGGKKATLHFPIPAALQSEAPATIPLWSLNDTTGLWKQEGTATRSGNEYVGTVGHFSFWNCDAPFPLVNFTATVQTQGGMPLSYSQVLITTSTGSTNVSGSGFTDENGLISGLIPANTALVLKVYDRCNNQIHTQNIGPFTATANLGLISVTAAINAVTFSGTVVNCNNAAVTSGYVTIFVDNTYYRASLTNGAFSTTVVRCATAATTAKVTANDVAGNQSSTEATIAVSGTTVATGQLIACGTLPDQYVYYTVNGGSYGFTAPADSITVSTQNSGSTWYTTIYAFPKTGYTPSFYLNLTGPGTPGTHSVGYLAASAGNITWIRNGTINANITAYSTTYGTGYIEGNFTGPVKDTANASSTGQMNATFRIKR